jgi:UDP-3-O-[3-hydroxymyristoyl] glucosamine N-acyltransferase
MGTPIINIVIIGSGALGREMISLIDDINSVQIQFQILGFLDDNGLLSSNIRGYFVLGGSDEIGNHENAQYVIAIANPALRKSMFEKVKLKGKQLPNIIHPSSKIDKHAAIKWDQIEGNILAANTFLSCDVHLGNNNFLNVGLILSHDTIIGNHNAIMQGCILNGLIEVKDECWIWPGIKINGRVSLNKTQVKLDIENYI